MEVIINGKKYINTIQLARKLGVAVVTVHTWVQAGLKPYKILGIRGNFFRWREVKTFLRKTGRR